MPTWLLQLALALSTSNDWGASDPQAACDGVASWVAGVVDECDKLVAGACLAVYACCFATPFLNNSTVLYLLRSPPLRRTALPRWASRRPSAFRARGLAPPESAHGDVDERLHDSHHRKHKRNQRCWRRQQHGWHIRLCQSTLSAQLAWPTHPSY